MNKSNKFSARWLLIYFFIGMFVGTIITLGFIQLEISPQWVTDQTCNNRTQIAFNSGLYYTAGYTGETGNFTYLKNGTIQTYPIEEYCLIQNLNNNMEVK